MCLDHWPPEIFLTCTLEAFLSTPPLKQHLSCLHRGSQLEQPHLSFFTNTEQPEVYTWTKKSISSQCYSRTTKIQNFVEAPHGIQVITWFPVMKKQILLHQREGSKRSSNLGHTLRVFTRTVSHFQVATSSHKQFWAWVIVQFQTAVLYHYLSIIYYRITASHTLL